VGERIGVSNEEPIFSEAAKEVLKGKRLCDDLRSLEGAKPRKAAMPTVFHVKLPEEALEKNLIRSF
jgi:hypothetical protein